MIDLQQILATSMDSKPLSAQAWRIATAQQRLYAARCIASNFDDGGEWDTQKARRLCDGLRDDVTHLLRSLRRDMQADTNHR